MDPQDLIPGKLYKIRDLLKKTLEDEWTKGIYEKAAKEVLLYLHPGDLLFGEHKFLIGDRISKLEGDFIEEWIVPIGDMRYEPK